jgi:DNA-directed RNA polymerase specialized sigma24 family protein
LKSKPLPDTFLAAEEIQRVACAAKLIYYQRKKAGTHSNNATFSHQSVREGPLSQYEERKGDVMREDFSSLCSGDADFPLPKSVRKRAAKAGRKIQILKEAEKRAIYLRQVAKMPQKSIARHLAIPLAKVRRWTCISNKLQRRKVSGKSRPEKF